LINCNGTKTTKTWAINPLYAVGKNAIITTTHLELRGVPTKTPLATLITPVNAGVNWIEVDKLDGWLPGDKIIITTT
jgi:hypothetical protein